MALPPIISNSPIFKLFKSSSPANGQTNSDQAKAQALKDSVSISTAAARGQKLTDKSLIADEAQARDAARQAREDLAANDVSLGLDPKFG